MRRVMERVKAQDTIDARVRQRDRPAVEQQELRRRPVSDDRLPPIQLSRHLERRFGHVQQNDAAAELREEAGEPSRARSEIEHGRASRQLQSLHQHRHVDEQRRRLVRLAERLGELMIPVA